MQQNRCNEYTLELSKIPLDIPDIFTKGKADRLLIAGTQTDTAVWLPRFLWIPGVSVDLSYCAVDGLVVALLNYQTTMLDTVPDRQTTLN